MTGHCKATAARPASPVPAGTCRPPGRSLHSEATTASQVFTTHLREASMKSFTFLGRQGVFIAGAVAGASVLWLAAAGSPRGLHAQAATGPEIKIGGIFDLTGITSDVGKSYAQGVRDAVEWTNAHGGINGKRLKLVDADYGYKIPEAVALYKRLVNDEKVVLIAGWGTGDTEALREQAAKDKMPYVSASFSAHLTDPAKNPYNFFVAPSYSDQLRAWLLWVKDDWKDKSRRPKVAALFGDNAYGRSPPARTSPRRTASNGSTTACCRARSRTPPASCSPCRRPARTTPTST